MVADGGGNGGKDRFNLVEIVTPVAGGVGPAEEDAILFFPFGRESSSCHDDNSYLAGGRMSMPLSVAF